ncbi:tetratricopeptide repeat protein [Streptomyces sp. NPDC060030]|uniref:tetratricopeptide repeat protein n=1 Tax=Streptomyces sp. NPDC060030 TaxID=3347042 RepID=UPI003675B697
MRSNLAAAYWQAGRTDKAITLEEAILTDRERILGTHHPNTITVRSDLVAYRRAGRSGLLGAAQPRAVGVVLRAWRCLMRPRELDE